MQEMSELQRLAGGFNAVTVEVGEAGAVEPLSLLDRFGGPLGLAELGWRKRASLSRLLASASLSARRPG